MTEETTDDGERHYWFTCSQCGVMQEISRSQANAEAEINCTTPTCGFQHYVGRVRPLVGTSRADVTPDKAGRFDRSTWVRPS